MFSERNIEMLQKIEGQESPIYINRDPVIFRYIILYLRNEGKLPIIQDNFTKELFEKELDFWGLPPDYN